MISQDKKELLKKFVNHRCEICRLKESELNKLVVHHIKRQHIEINDSIRNLMCVCEVCHRKLHYSEFQ